MRKFHFILCALPLAVQAATLSQVPMQGDMAMPMISYNAGEGRLHVVMPEAVPQLTPLLVSNPADSFDPAHPWFAALDPAAQGRSFSRRYGWVVAGGSDLLPPDTAIWIRKLAGDAQLSAHAYVAGPPSWTPIFGTDGSADARYWNGMMFHPVFSAPPGTNNLSATFEAYLVDTGSGDEILGTGTGPMVFNFTNVEDGRPALGAMAKLVVQWDAGATNWGLEWATSMTSSVWSAATNETVEVDGASTVLIDLNAAGKFFRLRRLP
ncbi:MAG: hypothetical protein M5U15_01525 [Kiritimatiellae bacterium]|nr:hypothetical protein [Kiritimatiellia bacterium]